MKILELIFGKRKEWKYDCQEHEYLSNVAPCRMCDIVWANGNENVPTKEDAQVTNAINFGK